MTSDRWDPFREMVTFREAMDRWLQQSISGTGQLLSNIRPESIPVDVVERDDSFEVRAAVPGVKPEDVEVTVQGERVTIRAEARLAAAVALAAALLTATIARPLLFASIAPDLAAARGVRTRLLGVAFVALVGVVAAEATQAVGALLLLGLLAAPAAAAQRLTPSPLAGIGLAAALAVVAMWGGLALAYAVPSLPPSSAVVAIAVALYYLAGLRR